jgi:hypothetical protein
MVSAIGLLKRLWNSPTSAPVAQQPTTAPDAEAIRTPEAIQTEVDPLKSGHNLVADTDYPHLPGSFFETSQTRTSSTPSQIPEIPTTQTNFRAPKGHLGTTRFAPVLHYSGALHRPLNNIAAPHTPILKAYFIHKNCDSTSTSSEPEDIEMLDAAPVFLQNPTPPATPPKTRDTSRSRQSSASPSRHHQPTVEDENKEAEAPGLGSPSTPNIGDHRPKAQMKISDNRNKETTGFYMRPDYASQVIMENFPDPDDPMPNGYWGTFGGHRMCVSTVEEYCTCGKGGGHYLICGHTVISNDPCGANCKTPQHEHEAFKCEQCETVIRDILSSKLTPQEQAKLEIFREKNVAFCIALAVEVVAKHMPTAKGNVAQTVTSIVMENYGRTCRAYTTVDDPDEPKNMADMFAQHHESGQRRDGDIRAKMDQEPLVAHEKRKESDGTQDDAQDSAKAPDVAAPEPASTANKKQKTKLETHTEPMTPSTHGTKRTATSPSASITATTVSPSKKPRNKLQTHNEPIEPDTRGTKRATSITTPLYSPTKKPKHKLQTHIEPIIPSTRGTKRSPSVEEFEASKRATYARPVFGEASFIPTPVFAKRRLRLEDVVWGEGEEL